MGVGTYSTVTFAQAKQMLADRLGDPNMVHWTDTELGLIIKEVLREWQALTGYWRASGTITLTANQPWYDLPTTLRDSGGNLLLPMTVTDSDLVSEIQYHLMEPQGIPWTGSTQFTLTEITRQLQNARNKFLMDTGSVINRSVQSVPLAADGRFQVDESIIDVRRVAWGQAP